MRPTLRMLITAGALVALAALAARPAAAGWPNDPAANVLLYAGSTGFHGAPVVTADGAGGMLVAYSDAMYQPWLERWDAHGLRRWRSSLSGANYSGYVWGIASDGAGGAFVTWQGATGFDQVYAQRVSADGAVLWSPGGVLVCAHDNYNPLPVVIADGIGGAVVAWIEGGYGPQNVAAQRLDAAGGRQWAANGIALSAPHVQTQNGTLRLLSDGQGGAIAVWADSTSIAASDVRAQRVDAGGTLKWGASGTLIRAAADSYDGPAAASDGVGGVYVLFGDWRSASENGVYVQRVGAAGAALWTAGGLRVSPLESVRYVDLQADGVGGAIAAWDVGYAPVARVEAQRIDPNGVVLWGSTPPVLCATTGDDWHPLVVADGAGGATVAWWDQRSGSWDLYAQRFDAVGTQQWTTNGLPISGASGDQWNHSVVSDGAGGVLAAWNDDRAGRYDDYAQHIDRWGVLGGAATIASIHDVPADQGGYVDLTWTRSPLDVVVANPIVAYWIYRQVPAGAAQAALARGARLVAEGARPEDSPRGLYAVTSANGETFYWQYVGYALADGRATYDAYVATACDSAPAGNPRTALMVEARSSGGARHWASAPDSGYSVDNLAPSAPTPFTGTYANLACALHWGKNPASDLGVYRLYRGSSPGFAVGPASFVVATSDTGYVDAAGGPYYYKVVAVDVHGNASAATFTMPSGTADVALDAPPAVALGPPAPNPFHLATTLRLALPAAARVTLAVYDQQGRRLRTLVDGALPAGAHALAWDGTDDAGRALPSALYFLRLETPSRTVTRRVAVVR